MELFKSRPRVVYTNAVGDKVYPVVVDIKKGIKSTEDIQFVSSDVNTGILSVAFIQGNDNYNVTGADVVCSVMRPDASTLELPCEVVGENIVEVPLGINGTSQDGVYSFDFKVFKGENKVVGTPIMNYSVSLSISNDMVVEEDDRLPILTMLITQVNELKEETSETINQANIATEASKEATANAIEATNNANAVSERVSQEIATAIAEIKQDTENAIDSINQSTSTAISTMNQNTTDAIADMTQKTNEAVTRVNDNLTNINNTVATKVSELDTAKSDMTNTVSNKVNEVETRFNALTSSQQQDAEVIDARDGEVSLKARLNRDIEKANKELDKIKKLEESTVSTVETENDFTTVESTSNGYFEGVKLEGKTLVNLARLDNLYVNHAEISDNVITLTQKDVDQNIAFRSSNIPFDSNNKAYTIFVNVLSNTCDGASSGSVSLNPSGLGKGNYALDYTGTIIQPKATGLFAIKATSRSVTSDILFHVCLRKSSTDTPIGNIKFQVIILEGDHTQNPPSYFEGLKSVGQSATTSEDGTDEIVVSSVKGDGNLVEYIELNGVNTTNGKDYTDNKYVRTNYITVEPNQVYYIKPSTNVLYKSCSVYFYDSNKSYLGHKSGLTSEFTTVANTKFIRIDMKKADNTDNTQEDINNCDFVVSKCRVSEYIPYQSDKKQLLYYNNETQAWEKPILREWDSIEKHANGKYYYHQRSGEVVLNGSENWNYPTGQVGNNTILLYSRISDAKINQNYPICDMFSGAYLDIWEPTNDIEGIFINHNKDCILRINKAKLSTQDVQGFKQWLQTNPVTVVYKLAEEKVYECTNIDLITHANETNYIVESGAIVPKSILKVHNNISNVVKILQEKVSLLESNVKASQEVQDMMILETDMRMLDIELALMEFAPMKLNLGGSDMLRSATYFNFLKNHIVNETYEKGYLENVMNKYLATGRINQDEYDELYNMLYPPVYDIELPIEP